MKKQQEVKKFVSIIWQEHMRGNRGIDMYKKGAIRFQKEMEELEKVTFFKILGFIFLPYDLSNYFNFKRFKRKTLKSFWRFSKTLLSAQKMHIANELSKQDWEKYRNDYFNTIESYPRATRMLVVSEVLGLW